VSVVRFFLGARLYQQKNPFTDTLIPVDMHWRLRTFLPKLYFMDFRSVFVRRARRDSRDRIVENSSPIYIHIFSGEKYICEFA